MTHQAESVGAWTGTRWSAWRWTWLLLAAVVLLSAGLWLIRGRSQPAAPVTGRGSTPRALPVVAEAATTGDMSVYLTGLGTVTALNTVTVRSRVDGQLIRRRVPRGSDRPRGRPAGRARSAALPGAAHAGRGSGGEGSSHAEGRAARSRSLPEPRDAGDSSRSSSSIRRGPPPIRPPARSRADQGQIDSARLNLTYARITAPITGRVGLRLVDPGNIVHASRPERPRRHHAARPDRRAVHDSRGQPAAAAAADAGRPAADGGRLRSRFEDRSWRPGSLLTIDNQIDLSTGTVKLKATFPNPDNAPLPEPVRQCPPARRHDSRRRHRAERRDSAQPAIDLRLRRQARQHGGCAKRHGPPDRRRRHGHSSAASSPGERRRHRRRRQAAAGHEGADPHGQQRRPQPTGRRRHEPVRPVHPPPDRDVAADGGAAAGRRRRLPATAGLGAAGSGLPDDSGGDVLSGREPGRDGVGGHRAARASVRTGARPEADDVDQLRRGVGHHAAVRPRL